MAIQYLVPPAAEKVTRLARVASTSSFETMGVNALNVTLANGLPKAGSIVAGLFYGYAGIADAAQPRITLGLPDKLSGQIILDSTNAPKPLVVGSVTVPRALMGRVVINGSTATTIATDMFPSPSAPLGGGAVGVASFQLYELDCTPPNNLLARHEGVVEIVRAW